MRKPGADLEQQLEKYRCELAEAREHLAEALEQQTNGGLEKWLASFAKTSSLARLSCGPNKGKRVLFIT